MNTPAVMWNEMFDEMDREPHTRLIEEQFEMRRKQKRLDNIDLPQGFRLVTPRPKQFWVKNQLVWCFALAWAPLDRQGERQEADLYWCLARYDWRVADESQMRWALDDFIRDLKAENVSLGDLSKYQSTPNTSPQRNNQTPPSHRLVA